MSKKENVQQSNTQSKRQKSLCPRVKDKKKTDLKRQVFKSSCIKNFKPFKGTKSQRVNVSKSPELRKCHQDVNEWLLETYIKIHFATAK